MGMRSLGTKAVDTGLRRIPGIFLDLFLLPYLLIHRLIRGSDQFTWILLEVDEST
mgnify:CR=1 FL=1